MDSQQRWYQQTVSLKGQVVADAGANVGKLSQFFFDAVGPKGKVVSIEPVPANVKAIEKRIKKAGPAAKKRWTLKKCAVSAEVGKVTLRLLKADWGTNAMVVGGNAGTELTVAARPLWDLVPDATIVKLDIEGHEYEVLPGALEAMPKVKAWLLELHGVEGQRLEDTLAMLIAQGYTLVAAGQQKQGGADGPWVSVPIDPSLTWEAIPGTRTVRDGMPGVFKMLHVIAKKD